MGSTMMVDSTMEQAKLLGRMKVIAANKGIAGAKLNRASAYHVLETVEGLKGELRGCRAPAEFAAVLEKYEQEIEKRLRLSAKAQQCAANAPEMLVREYVHATGIATETVRPLIFMNKFKADEVEKIVDRIEKGEVKVESEADIEQAFAGIVKKYVADRQKLAEEADEIEAAVFELKKPSDVGEGVAQNDYINLKQLNSRILQSARELHEAKNAQDGKKAEPVVAGGNGPEALRGRPHAAGADRRRESQPGRRRPHQGLAREFRHPQRRARRAQLRPLEGRQDRRDHDPVFQSRRPAGQLLLDVYGQRGRLLPGDPAGMAGKSR